MCKPLQKQNIKNNKDLWRIFPFVLNKIFNTKHCKVCKIATCLQSSHFYKPFQCILMWNILYSPYKWKSILAWKNIYTQIFFLRWKKEQDEERIKPMSTLMDWKVNTVPRKPQFPPSCTPTHICTSLLSLNEHFYLPVFYQRGIWPLIKVWSHLTSCSAIQHLLLIAGSVNNQSIPFPFIKVFK